MVTRRKFLIAASGLSVGVSLGTAACSTDSVAPAAESRTITVAMPGHPAPFAGISQQPPELSLRALSENPADTAESRGLTIQLLPVRNWNARSSDRAVHDLFAADPPDIVLAPADSIGPLARAGYIVPVSQFSERSEEDLWTADALVAGARSLGLARGQRWALPLTGVPTALLCNRKLVEEAGYGLLLETPLSLTWDKFREFARAATRRGTGEEMKQWGLFIATYGLPHLAMWFWQNGVEFFDHATRRTLPVTEASVEALEILVALTQQDRVSPYIGHSNVHWEGSVAHYLLAPAISNVSGTAGPKVPVAAWVAPARQSFYAPGNARISRTLALAQLPHKRRRASLLHPMALLAVSSETALDPALQWAVKHVTRVLENDPGFGLPLRREVLHTWAAERLGEAEDEEAGKNIRQAVAALEVARAEYVEGTLDFARFLDFSILGMNASPPLSSRRDKGDTRELLTRTFAGLDAWVKERCAEDGCRTSWESEQ